MRALYFGLLIAGFSGGAAVAMPAVSGTYICKSDSYRNPSELTIIEKDDQLFIEGPPQEVTNGLFCENGKAERRLGREQLVIEASCTDQSLSVLTTSINILTKDAITTQIRITRLSDRQSEIWFSFKIKSVKSDKEIEVKALCDRQSSAG